MMKHVTEHPKRLAAIDLGTNSFHLVVVELKPNGKFTVLGREKEVVRLGEGFTDMKHLSTEAMERAHEALQRFALIAESHNAHVRAIATSAVREAKNRDDFVGHVHLQYGIRIEVVSGFEEARLIYLGALQALPVYHKKILLVDIGGGSTEFLVGKSGHVHYANSLKLGAVRLSRRFFTSKTLHQRDIDECRTFLAGALHPIRRALKDEPIDVAVGSSGTILNLAGMIQAAKGKPVPIDEGNITFTRMELHAIVAHILDQPTLARRRKIPGLDPARADIIVAGALILEQVVAQLGLRSMVTSKYAMREGIILDTIQKFSGDEHATAHLGDIRKSSVMHLAETCRYESRHAANVTRMALELFDLTCDLHKLGKSEREYLESAGILHDIGYHISHSQHHLHSYYIIRHAELLGFTEEEKDVIANVARYHRKSHPKEKHEDFTGLAPRDKSTVRKLSAILRIADGLDRRHKGLFRALHIEHEGRTVRITLHAPRHDDFSLELWGAERRKELFEDEFKVRVEFSVTDSEQLNAGGSRV